MAYPHKSSRILAPIATALMIAVAGAAQASDSVRAVQVASSAPPSANLGGRPLQQVAITTTDLARSVRFYRDTLGLRFLFESNGMAFFDLAGVRLMVALDPSRGPTRPTSIVYIDSDDVSGARQRLLSLGVPLEGDLETVVEEPTRTLNLQQFVDPDGNALAVMGWTANPEHGTRRDRSDRLHCLRSTGSNRVDRTHLLCQQGQNLAVRPVEPEAALLVQDQQAALSEHLQML